MNDHPKTEVEPLPDDQRRLQAAMPSARPLPASNIEECLEVLRNPRRVSVEQHQRFRESLAPKPDLDEIDELVDIPGPVQMRKSREVSRLLSILDELETGKDGRH
jgi:hypothetical protein